MAATAAASRLVLVLAAALGWAAISSSAMRCGVILRLRRVVDDLDVLVVEGREHVVDLIGSDRVGGQRFVHVVVREEALVLAEVDESLNAFFALALALAVRLGGRGRRREARGRRFTSRLFQSGARLCMLLGSPVELRRRGVRLCLFGRLRELCFLRGLGLARVFRLRLSLGLWKSLCGGLRLRFRLGLCHRLRRCLLRRAALLRLRFLSHDLPH